MRKDLKEALKKAYEIPQPSGKDAFIKRLRPRKITIHEFLITQVCYIRKVIWGFSIVILLISALGVQRFPEEIVKLIGSVLPFSAVLGILETYRSYTHKMNELEQATRFSLRSVLYARLLIIGIMNTAVILISAIILSSGSGVSVVFVIAKLMIPYLLTMALGLHVERSVYGRNNNYISFGIAAAVSLLTFWLDVMGRSFIIALSESITVAVAVALLVLTIWEMFRTIRITEAYV